MAFVTRYHVEDLVGGYWAGEDFTRNADWALEYTDADEAELDALECNGAVVPFERWACFADLPRAPQQFLQAAE